MIVINNFHGFIFAGLFLLAGCSKQPCKDSSLMSSAPTVLDVYTMPKQAPKDLQTRLVWGLWQLDQDAIKTSLGAGANPYTLATRAKGLRPIPEQKELSPYAIALEGYLNSTYLEEKVENICRALDRLYACLDFLIRNKVSVDQGVITLDANPSMREFVRASINRLNEEKRLQGMLDDEGKYALRTLEHIQALINKHQPEINRIL